ncbi:histone H3.v1-like isoform X2 [Senna tora]|uniref:Histone H3.v1-like isoform X2 n=1 Tax=Senna tora TaxID=362788 RepID=A0A834TCU6_9FABA|nr:histone H3.v1-like isoform X2 [Senna tora]
MEGSQRKRGVQNRRLSIIDVSSADDSLLDPVSGDHHKKHSGHLYENQEHVELLDTPNSKNFEDATSKLEEWEQEPRPTETFEIGKAKKNSKCNLRKSLAWDSAFFTSAGVLDPEELSSIIEGVEKDEKHALPCIKEDVHLSCESLTTLESDSMTLESLEADLFEDIRASIQKSSNTSNATNGNRKMPSGMAGFQTGECKHALPGIKEDIRKSCESITTLESDSLTLESLETDLFEDIRASIQKSGKMSNVANGKSKVPSRVAGFQTGDVLKKIGIAPGNKMNASPSSKNPSSTSMQSGKTMKNPPRPHVLQVSATRSESSTIKQSKVPAKSIPSLIMSAKRASLGGLHIGSEKDKANRVIGGRVSSVSKAPTLGGSRGVVPKTTLSSKSSSAPSVATKTNLSTSTSLGSNSSGNIGKSPLNSVKRKVDARTVKPPASGSAVRTPSKIGSRNKTDSGNCGLSGLTSDTKLSSSISPASSVSDWSSESSSSTCVTKQRSNSSRTSIDSISSCRKVSSDTDTPQVSSSLNTPSDLNLEGQESQLIGVVNQCARSSSAGAVLPPGPMMKPSGLRLPSPKIGFFDGMKSSVRTPRGGMQSHTVVPSGLPKHGRCVNPSEGQNKAKIGKLQSTRSIMSIKNAKPTSHPNLHESSDVAVETFSGSQTVKISSELPKEVVNTMLLESAAGNINMNMTEGHIMETHDISLGLTHNIGIVNISMEKTSSEIKDSISSMDVRATSTDEERKRSDLSSTYDVENSSQIVGEGSTCGESNLPKAEGPDIGMLINHPCDTENKKVLDISMHNMIPEGNNAMHSEISIDTSTVGLYNPSVSTTEIDCLSSKLEVMGINSETQEKFNGPLSFSQTDLCSQDYPKGVVFSSRKELDCPKQVESLNGPNTPSLYMAASTRRPFAVKDSFCNMDDLSCVSTESTVAEVKSTILSSSESMMKENN